MVDAEPSGVTRVHGFDEQRPAASLAGLVSTIYVQRAAAAHTDIAIPKGSVELRCRIGSVPEVVGPQTRPLPQPLEPGTTVIGIRFHAGAASAVLGVSASELVDQTVDGGELLGRAAGVVGEQVAETGSPTAGLALLQRLVEDRLPEAADPEPMVGVAVRSLMPWPGTSVASLSSRLGLSERHLERRCRASVGLTPKVLQRILRFQGFLAMGHRVLAQAGPRRGWNLAILAVEAGYADQPHLTRECVRLAGRTPAVLLDEIARDCAGHHHGPWFAPILWHRPTIQGLWRDRS